MKVTVLVDGIDKGSLEVGGGELVPYHRLVAACNDLACSIYASENPEGPEQLIINSESRLKMLPKRPRKARHG